MFLQQYKDCVIRDALLQSLAGRLPPELIEEIALFVVGKTRIPRDPLANVVVTEADGLTVEERHLKVVERTMECWKLLSEGPPEDELLLSH